MMGCKFLYAVILFAISQEAFADAPAHCDRGLVREVLANEFNYNLNHLRSTAPINLFDDRKGYGITKAYRETALGRGWIGERPPDALIKKIFNVELFSFATCLGQSEPARMTPPREKYYINQSIRRSSEEMAFSASTPFLGNDKNSAIIYVTKSCLGMCGSNILTYYVRKGRRWRNVGHIVLSVS